jgi:hypothetical protein
VSVSNWTARPFAFSACGTAAKLTDEDNEHRS